MDIRKDCCLPSKIKQAGRQITAGTTAHYPLKSEREVVGTDHWINTPSQIDKLIVRAKLRELSAARSGDWAETRAPVGNADALSASAGADPSCPGSEAADVEAARIKPPRGSAAGREAVAMHGYVPKEAPPKTFGGKCWKARRAVARSGQIGRSSTADPNAAEMLTLRLQVNNYWLPLID